MSNAVTFTTAADGGDPSSSGGDTGVAAVFGTAVVGSLLPLGTATHWRVVAVPYLGTDVQFSVDDATLAQNAFTSLLVEDVLLFTADAAFSQGGGASTWEWASGAAASHLFPSLNVGVALSVTTPTVTLAVPTIIDGTGVLLEWTTANTAGHIVDGFAVYRNGALIANDLDPTTLVYSDQTDAPETTFTYQIAMKLGEENDVLSNAQTITTGCETAEFNCACETVSAYSTLAQLRARMAIQCGYAAMAANLPAGQSAEFNEYLFSAQKQLYYKFRAQRTERFFKWAMVPGQRYYGLADSEDCCDLKLDPLAITWVGFEDLNRAWYRLIEGIDPVYYTRANINFGWPTRYEIRSCIEVFPAPQAAYTLWIKGDIGLAPFTVDADRPTFDDEAILLFAVANWKSAKGRQDAERCMGQATQRIQDLTARKHGTARYVPSTYVQSPATPPRFLPLGSQQS